MSKKKSKKKCCACCVRPCCDKNSCCCQNMCGYNNYANNNMGFGGCDNGAWEAIIFWLIACGAGLLNTNSILIILLFLLYGWSCDGNFGSSCC